MITPISLFLTKEKYQTVNKERLMIYLTTFTELHNLHQKQNENLRKVVENHEKRIEELTKRIEEK